MSDIQDYADRFVVVWSRDFDFNLNPTTRPYSTYVSKDDGLPVAFPVTNLWFDDLPRAVNHEELNYHLSSFPGQKVVVLAKYAPRLLGWELFSYPEV
jgi:hypothetical protein